MNGFLRLAACAAIVAGCAVSPAPGQTILDLHQNGTLTWENSDTNAHFTLQWAPSMTGGWRTWSNYTYVASTGPVMSVDVPMFFRLALHTNVNYGVPPDGRIVMVVGQDSNTIATYVASNGVTPGGVMLYTSVQDADGLTNAADYGAGVQHGQYLANRYSNSIIQIGLYMVDADEGVTGGVYDANLDKIADWIKGLDRPAYLRIAYEFDAQWTHHYQDTDAFKAAWRYMVDRFRARGVANAAYVWHSYGSYDPAVTNRLMDFYPGDGYVDWFGVSVFGQIMGPGATCIYYVAETAMAHHKPLMIAESTPHGIGATNGAWSWSDWFWPTFNFIEKYDVKMFSYIACDWESLPMHAGQGWGDARVHMDPYVKGKWTERMANTVFLQASTNLFRMLGYSP